MMFGTSWDSNGEAVFWLILGAGAPIAYMTPWILSLYLNRPQSLPIFFLNAAFGWTAFGWVGSLVWAWLNFED